MPLWFSDKYLILPSFSPFLFLTPGRASDPTTWPIRGLCSFNQNDWFRAAHTQGGYPKSLWDVWCMDSGMKESLFLCPWAAMMMTHLLCISTSPKSAYLELKDGKAEESPISWVIWTKNLHLITISLHFFLNIVCTELILLLWQPDAKSQLIRKDPGAGKDWRQKEKGTAEDEVVR